MKRLEAGTRMNTRSGVTRISCVGLVLALFLAWANMAGTEGPNIDERVQALKQQLEVSKQSIRQYEWVETTTIVLKGDEKARKQSFCYYGADGKLQKVAHGAGSTEASSPGGLRGRAAKRKKAALKDYVEQAVDLIKAYVPPDPARIQTARDAGRIAFGLLQPGKTVEVQINDYLKAGDRLSIRMDITTNRMTGLTLSSYLEKPEDTVVMSVTMGSLNDGTSYAESVDLDLASEKLEINVENSGYRLR